MTRNALLYLVVAVLALAACGDRKETAATKTAVAPAPAVPAAPATATSYAATLAEGITFSKPGYPEFISKVAGISNEEAFGRWTDGPKAVLEFKEPLPRKFDLIIQGAAYGPNVGQPIQVTTGSVSREISFDGDLTIGPQIKRVTFDLPQAANSIEFLIPHPTQPSNGDVRKLGIALVDLKIEAAAR